MLTINAIKLLQYVYGVVKVTLGDICEIIRGNGLQKKDFVETGIPCIHYGQIYTYYGLSTKTTKSFVSPEVANKLKKAQTGDVIVATTSENDADLCKSVVWLGDSQVSISGDSLVLRHEQVPKYIGYYLQCECFQEQKAKFIYR